MFNLPWSCPCYLCQEPRPETSEAPWTGSLCPLLETTQNSNCLARPEGSWESTLWKWLVDCCGPVRTSLPWYLFRQGNPLHSVLCKDSKAGTASLPGRIEQSRSLTAQCQSRAKSRDQEGGSGRGCQNLAAENWKNFSWTCSTPGTTGSVHQSTTCQPMAINCRTFCQI